MGAEVGMGGGGQAQDGGVQTPEGFGLHCEVTGKARDVSLAGSCRCGKWRQGKALEAEEWLSSR